MTANETKIRQCYNDGLTTPSAIRPHVSCNDDTISRILSRITTSIQDSPNFDVVETLKTKAQKASEYEQKELRSDLEAITRHLGTITDDDKQFIPYQRQKMAILARLSKLEGVEILHKVAERKAMETEKEGGDSREGGAWRPATAKKAIEV